MQRWIGLLLHADTVVAHAVITLIRRGVVPVTPLTDEAPLPPPEASRPFQFPFFREADGYHTAMETRLARGAWGSGRAAAWMRQRVPLVPGATPSPLERVLVAADCGSGVSAAIAHESMSAINADLTVAVSRPLEGESVASTRPRPTSRTASGWPTPESVTPAARSAGCSRDSCYRRAAPLTEARPPPSVPTECCQARRQSVR